MTQAPGITLQGGASIREAPLFAPVTLTLRAGEWTCLLGGSGVGKSTLLRLIAGLDTGATFDGTITASDGAPWRRARPTWRRTTCCCHGPRCVATFSSAPACVESSRTMPARPASCTASD